VGPTGCPQSRASGPSCIGRNSKALVAIGREQPLEPIEPLPCGDVVIIGNIGRLCGERGPLIKRVIGIPADHMEIVARAVASGRPSELGVYVGSTPLPSGVFGRQRRCGDPLD
jgi:hypothetical protein